MSDDHLPTIDYPTASSLLDELGQAWETHDGDRLIALFTDDAEYHESPFQPPLVGHNAIRALLLDASRSRDQAEVTVEQHWVSGSTVLAAWHMSFVRRSDRARIRIAGFMTLEVRDGRCYRFRQWAERRPDGEGAG